MFNKNFEGKLNRKTVNKIMKTINLNDDANNLILNTSFVTLKSQSTNRKKKILTLIIEIESLLMQITF